MTLRRRPVPPNGVKGPAWTGEETPAPFDDPRVVAAREYWHKLRDQDRSPEVKQDQPITEE